MGMHSFYTAEASYETVAAVVCTVTTNLLYF